MNILEIEIKPSSTESDGREIPAEVIRIPDQIADRTVAELGAKLRRLAGTRDNLRDNLARATSKHNALCDRLDAGITSAHAADEAAAIEALADEKPAPAKTVTKVQADADKARNASQVKLDDLVEAVDQHDKAVIRLSEQWRDAVPQAQGWKQDIAERAVQAALKAHEALASYRTALSVLDEVRDMARVVGVAHVQRTAYNPNLQDEIDGFANSRVNLAVTGLVGAVVERAKECGASPAHLPRGGNVDALPRQNLGIEQKFEAMPEGDEPGISPTSRKMLDHLAAI